jgi:hypothetical protein
MKIAPICLFLYNRPYHALQTVNALSKAQHANKSKLFVFCDGAKQNATQQDIDNISEVRRIADNIEGFEQVTVIKQDENQGLANSILSGVTRVVKEFGKVIVLEDDHVVHVDFLNYMNHYLNIYSEKKRVMHIGGLSRNSYLQFFMNTVFFTRYMDCWGWATWSDRWDKLIMDFKIIDSYLEIPFNFEKFNFSKLDYHTYFEPNREKLKTWAIFWYFTIAIHNGLCLMPKFSYVKNIGNDGSGSNNVVKTAEISSNFIGKFKPKRIKVKESKLGEYYIQDAYAKRSRKRFNSVKSFLHQVLNSIRNLVIQKI